MQHRKSRQSRIWNAKNSAPLLYAGTPAQSGRRLASLIRFDLGLCHRPGRPLLSGRPLAYDWLSELPRPDGVSELLRDSRGHATPLPR